MSLESISERMERLERQNRRLGALCMLSLAAPLVTLVGWQGAPRPLDLVRTRRLEVVDARGVPLVVLEPARGDEGGSVVLRDRNGERRGWWQVAPTSGAFGMVSGDEAAPKATLGLSVAPDRAQVSALGQDSSVATLGVEGTRPVLDLRDGAGKSVFRAPWR